MAKLGETTLVKCMIKNLDEGTEVHALFNPKEISIDKTVPWQQHKTSKGDKPKMEFTSAQPATFSCELFFDTYEMKSNVHDSHVSKLQELTMVKESAGSKKDKRPPMVMFVWGTAFPSFKGVIESLSTKYTMFLPDGTPVRATCTVKITEARSAERKVKKKRKKKKA